jgi:succinoglycan biosynthesis transport protein ExoP
MIDAYADQPPLVSADAVPLPPVPDSTPHLLDRLHVLFRHRRLIFTVLLLVCSIAMLQTWQTVPLYKAQTRIVINDERSTAVVGFNNPNVDYWQEEEPYYQTQYRVLASRGLARKAVRRLRAEGITSLDRPTPRSLNLANAISSASSAVRQVIRGWVQPAQTGAATETQAADEDARESALINGFLGRVDVQPVRGTRLVDVFFVDDDPALAVRAANVLGEEYVQQNLDLRLDTTRKSLLWLNDEIAKQEKKVRDSEAALAGYRERQNAMSLDQGKDIVGAKLGQLNTEVTRAKTTRVQKQALYEQVKSISPDDPKADTYPAIARSAAIVSLRARITDLDAQKAQLSEKYGEKWPALVAVSRDLDSARHQLRQEVGKAIDSIRNDYRSALAEEQSLTGQLEEQKRVAMDLGQKSVGYSVLEKDAQTDREVYQTLLSRQKELSVASNSRANNVYVMDHAETPKTPFSPNVRREFLMALGLGLVLALSLAFGLDYMDDTVRTPEDITRRLALPLLGLVPAVGGDRLPVLSGAVPHDFGEAFRSLRTSLVFTGGGPDPRIVLVTSAQPLEGKTTTACNIAIALALGGARVLMIDADMRRPGLHKTLGIKNGIGLSHVLVGQARVREAVQRLPEQNLTVITAGRTPPNPSELLASPRMQELLANLAHGPFEWIIVDTPPVLAVTDAVIIAPWVSGVAFVVGAEMTPRRLAQRAVHTLQTSRPQILGVVLNRVDFDRNKYYYSRYYGSQYKSYYGQGDSVQA